MWPFSEFEPCRPEYTALLLGVARVFKRVLDEFRNGINMKWGMAKIEDAQMDASTLGSKF